MRKTLRFMMVAALAAMSMFQSVAMADDGETKQKSHVSANGTYEFRPTWGVGIQYGLTFTEMTKFNDNFLVPGGMNYYDANFVAEHELYVEVSPVEGFRISVFGGYQSLYIKETGFNYIYGGIEPAFAVRRSFFELAVGLGLAYGGTIFDTKSPKTDKEDLKGHGLLVRPFVEARFYPADIFAIYLRVAFGYYKEFGVDASETMKANDKDSFIKTDDLEYAGPNVAVGIRFGNYEEPIKVIPDTDKDGVLDDVDECVDIPGTEQYYGCPSPDTDGDGYCDSWVAEKGLSDLFADICKGTDKCNTDAEDFDNFEDEDGCPDADNDKDLVCDPWVAEKGLSDKYADTCKGSDLAPDEPEDIDNFLDEDGAPDADNDGDAFCDPWVSDQGLFEKYADLCKDVDWCPNVYSNDPRFHGCANPDPDDDGYCDAWVYDQHLEAKFACKGLDKCPNEKGTDDKGCIPRRVEVTADKIEIREAINFKLNKAVIEKSSDDLLNEIATVFKENPQIKKVEIQGHTDLSGNAKKNQKLSEQRAKSVLDRLVKLGVEKDRLTSKGYGMTQPVEPLAPGQKKETAEQAAKNRRVVFEITEQDEVKKVVEIPAP